MPDSTLYLYTSLTAGSSHIVTATARLETILKANRIPFRAIDVATDDKARQLWGRRARGKKLPGLVKYGTIVGVGFKRRCYGSSHSSKNKKRLTYDINCRIWIRSRNGTNTGNSECK